ncbi:MAG: beta-hydroxyacyl-ACP dehydratase [Bacteroidetes bacterium]|nr:beta-hydroxyacyl-ACP dehydratase [Bacteroidota bacterium]
MRFFLVDRVIRIVPGESIEGIKCWTLTDEVFQDHFPGFPVVPSVLMIESMAQLLGILIEKSHLKEYPSDSTVYPVISIVHNDKFREMIIPGDQCLLKGNLLSLDVQRASGKVEVFVDNRLMAEAILSFIILSKEELRDNRWINRREEYLHVITKKRPGNMRKT